VFTLLPVVAVNSTQTLKASTPGMGATDLSTGSAKWSTVPATRGEDFFYSLVRTPGTDGFLSLAPSAAYGALSSLAAKPP
jgi:hypothetical protein